MEVLDNAIRQENEIKGIEIVKEEMKLFVYDIVVYTDNPKESAIITTTMKNLLKLISNYNKIAGYRINIQKSTVILYKSNENIECEIKNTIHLY